MKNLLIFSLLMVAAINCVGAGGIGEAIGALSEKVNEVLDAVEESGKYDHGSAEIAFARSIVQCVKNCRFNTECQAACGSGASCLKVSGMMTTIMIVLSALAAYIWE